MPKGLAFSFQFEEGRNIGLNRRLPRITQRNVSPSGRFDYSISRTRRQTTPGLFAGAACLKKFVAIHVPRKIARGPLGAIQSGSPPDARLRSWLQDSDSLHLLFATREAPPALLHRNCLLLPYTQNSGYPAKWPVLRADPDRDPKRKAAFLSAIASPVVD